MTTSDTNNNLKKVKATGVRFTATHVYVALNDGREIGQIGRAHV